MAGSIQAAPGKLNLIQEFVNTYDILNQKEELTSSEQLHLWFGQRGLLSTDEQVNEVSWQRTLALREALRVLLMANNGSMLDAEVITTLNHLANATHLSVRFDSNGTAHLEPTVAGVEGALSHILAIVFAAISDGTWARLKACRNPACHYVSYDYSKNRSGTWCTMAICGNRLKTRTYRRRRQVTKGQA